MSSVSIGGDKGSSSLSTYNASEFGGQTAPESEAATLVWTLVADKELSASK
jgi:hypothetical protein